MAADSDACERRILVVDDDVALAEATRLLLETLGYPAWVANGGLEALEMAQQIAPTLIFLDLQMPGMDGFAVACRLRRRYGNAMTLVAYTGLQDDNTRQRVWAAGFDHYLPKPATARAIRCLLTPEKFH